MNDREEYRAQAIKYLFGTENALFRRLRLYREANTREAEHERICALAGEGRPIEQLEVEALSPPL